MTRRIYLVTVKDCARCGGTHEVEVEVRGEPVVAAVGAGNDTTLRLLAACPDTRTEPNDIIVTISGSLGQTATVLKVRKGE